MHSCCNFAPSNPTIANLVESKIKLSQSVMCWNSDSYRFKKCLLCPSCCNLVWEWKDLNSAAGPFWLRSVRLMTSTILAVIINLPIVSTMDGFFEGKKRQGVRTTEPRHSARQHQALGVLVPVLKLVSYCHMSASDKRWRTLSRVGVAFAYWCDFNLPILHWQCALTSTYSGNVYGCVNLLHEDGEISFHCHFLANSYLLGICTIH